MVKATSFCPELTSLYPLLIQDATNLSVTVIGMFCTTVPAGHTPICYALTRSGCTIEMMQIIPQV